MSRTRLFAFEEDEVVVDEVVDTDNLAAGIIEDETTLTDSTDPIIDGIAAADELTEVKEVMDQSIKAGTGMDPVAAEMARISLKNILSKIGAESYAPQLMVASESFGSTSSRLANTRYASENVGKLLGEVWAKIKKFFIDLYNNFMNFLKNTFDRNTILLKRTEKLIAKTNIPSSRKEKLNEPFPVRVYNNLIDIGNPELIKGIETMFINQGTKIKEYLVYVNGMATYLADFENNVKKEDNSSPEATDTVIPKEGSFYNGATFKVQVKTFMGKPYFTESEPVIIQRRPTEVQALIPNNDDVKGYLADLKDLLGTHMRNFKAHLDGISKGVKTETKKIGDNIEDKELAAKYKLLMKYLSHNVRVSGMIVSNTHMMSSDVLTFTEKLYR